MDAQQKQQLAERLSQANNILVTVSANPSVDQLAACIGLTLAMNKLGKHAAAVFSGQVPSTIEFLQPEKTLEKNTDSLRDFIIALDKSKADKLRYKVEDKVVKIFITPYKTSISEKDFEFSQGDFNVDVVVALGVHSQADIDQAITAHGRILHDATVATINTKPGGELGAINWLNPTASSLSELVVQLLDVLNKKVIDGQMATALLTGIVSETVRFSNAKTSPQTMTVSAELLAAGANQQLVATKLEPPKPVAPPPPPPPPPVQAKPAPVPAAAPPPPPPPKMQASTKQQSQTEGMLEIEHPDKLNMQASEDGLLTPQIDIDREGTLRSIEEMEKEKLVAPAAAPSIPPANPASQVHADSTRHILQTPANGQTVNSPIGPQAGTSSLSLPSPGDEDIERPSGAPPLPPPSNAFSSGPTHNFVAPPPSIPPPKLDMPATPTVTPAPATLVPPSQPNTNGPDGRTLSQIEQDVGSPHVAQVAAAGGGPQYTPVVSMLPPQPAQGAQTPVQPTPPADNPMPASPQADLSSARDAVNQAISAQPGGARLEPIAALNAMPLNLPLRGQPDSNPPTSPGGGGVVIGPAPGFPSAPAGTDMPPPGPPPMMPPQAQ